MAPEHMLTTQEALPRTSCPPLGAAFLWPAGRFARRLELGDARWLFYVSITYLPLLLSLLAINKICH